MNKKPADTRRSASAEVLFPLGKEEKGRVPMDNNITSKIKLYNNIPIKLQRLDQWVCFKMEVDPRRKDDKPTKVPYDAKTGTRAKANDPATWTTFSTALNALKSGKYSGLGFEFGNGVFGIDLDHVIDTDGNLTDRARQIVDVMRSYTEISPSGTGLHILCTGTIPDGDRRRDEIEIYSEGRFFTITGNIFEEPRDIEERTSEAAVIHEAFIKRHKTAEQTSTPKQARIQIGISDRELLDKIFRSTNGDKIERLYRGDWNGSYGSQSEADQALCNYLAWWTNRDTARIDNIFRGSGLMRPKWDEKHGAETYGAKTIEKAIAGTSGGYDPTARSEASPGKQQQSKEHVSSPTWTMAAEEHEEFGDEAGTDPDGPPALPGAEALVPVSIYLNSDFKQDIKDHTKYKDRKTGFKNLDDLHGALYSGMYVLGATSSLGKTTLMLQLCDQLASAGEFCIYFTLEQNRLELVSKSISRYTSIIDSSNAATSNNIKNGYMTEVISDAMKKYKIIAEHINIVDGRKAFDLTVSKITATIKQSIIDFGRKPIVFVDYLQIIQPENDPIHARLTGKDKIDDITRRLKQLQSEEDLLMFVISSFNRSNYMTPVDFESFKESGLIEYTADVLWGLQLSVLHNPIFDKDKDQKKKRELIQQAKKRVPRQIELVCLKNRYGGTYSCRFDYNPYFDIFHDAEAEYTEGNADEEDKRQISTEKKTDESSHMDDILYGAIQNSGRKSKKWKGK